MNKADQIMRNIIKSTETTKQDHAETFTKVDEYGLLEYQGIYAILQRLDELEAKMDKLLLYWGME